MSDERSSGKNREKDVEATKNKGKFIFFENISILCMMIIYIYLIVSQFLLKLTTKTGKWYDYTILIVLGFLCVIVALALIKQIFVLVFMQRRGESSNKDS